MPFPILPSNSASGYFLNKSLRFRGSANGQLARTFTSAGNKKTWTWSAWIKRGAFPASVIHKIFTAESPPTYDPDGYIAFGGSVSPDSFRFQSYNGGVNASFITTQVFRDPSAWYHFVVAVDTTQATNTNRVKIYVNGNQITAFSTATYPSQNADLAFNGAYDHILGSAGYSFDGYLAEVNFINALQLAPTSFGSFNSLTGVWQPAKYTGAYSTNGFYLPFTNTTSTTTIGYDFSGNSNNFTSSNISLTAGSTYDSMTDVPTLTSATTANYCVVNAVYKSSDASITAGNLNVRVGDSATIFSSDSGTVGVSSGKWYYEFIQTNIYTTDPPAVAVGWAYTTHLNTQYAGSASSWSYVNDGTKYNSGTSSSYGSAWTTNDIIGVALDLDAGTLTYYKNNTSQGTAVTGLSGTFIPCFGRISNDAGRWVEYSVNFGQRPFTYTPPTGFVALNAYNLPTSTIVKGNTVMDATLYTGNATTNNITSLGFQPDFSWFKCRSESGNNIAHDVLRGTGGVNRLFPNLTNAESTNGDGFVTLTSTGFNLDGGGGGGDVNGMTGGVGRTYVAWSWKANGAGSSNTSGSITSTVSVNASAGFSIVTYTGNGTAGATIGHGLGIAPSIMIFKGRNTASSWLTWSIAYGSNQAQMLLDSTAAIYNPGNGLYFNSTYPSSSVATLGTSGSVNGSGTTYVAYMWSEIAGFSKFGSYTGNGSTDGTFVYLGFRPKYMMIKRSDTADSWVIMDTSRNPYNAVNLWLQAESSGAESTLGTPQFDFVSNGMKLRGSSSTDNASGGTYIYLAFAENPFKNALAR
jgi:hypothetical protein